MLTFIGSVAALLLGGLAVITEKHAHHVPGRRGADWAHIAAIALALLASVEMAYAGAGALAVQALDWGRGLLGAYGGAVFVLLALLAALTVAIRVRGHAGSQGGGGRGGLWVAFGLPLLCATFSSGIFHSLNTHLAPMAQTVTAQITQALGG